MHSVLVSKLPHSYITFLCARQITSITFLQMRIFVIYQTMRYYKYILSQQKFHIQFSFPVLFLALSQRDTWTYLLLCVLMLLVQAIAWGDHDYDQWQQTSSLPYAMLALFFWVLCLVLWVDWWIWLAWWWLVIQ